MRHASRTSSEPDLRSLHRRRKALALDRIAASRRQRIRGPRGSSRLVVTGIVVALGAASFVVATAADIGDAQATDCWDEYTLTGDKVQRVVTPKGVPVGNCTVPTVCLDGWNASGSVRNRLYVPHGRPKSFCTVPPTTTTTTTPPTTTPPTGRFGTLPVGAPLPSEQQCADAVRRMTENRPENVTYNATRGTSPNDVYPRVTGNFTGTTDEVLQWVACKWGIDEDLVRAQIALESWWTMSAVGDNGESFGLGQVRVPYHQSAFEDDNAKLSSAYNVDYTYAVWRACFEGEFTWLNTVDRGAEYGSGDAIGCTGVWFSGRWYTDAAIQYITTVKSYLQQKIWTTSSFGPASPAGTSAPEPTTTAAPTTTVAPTTTTAAPTSTSTTTTITTTTAPPTTTAAPTTTSPPSGTQFVETFTGNTGLDRFDTAVYHRNMGTEELGSEPVLWGGNNGDHGGSWTGDHDLSCGGPDTQRDLRSTKIQDENGSNGWEPIVDFNLDEIVYNCKDHMMTSMGAVDGYSIVTFSPKMVFDDVTRVSFDVNLTDLLSRQWWKVGVVSEARYNSTYNGSPGFLVSDVGSADLPTSLATSDLFAATWGGGASAGYPGGHMKIGNTNVSATSNPTPNDKATRHPVSLVDNRNGTITFTVAGVSATANGSFPACPCRVVFYDHNYTPDKDGTPVGHTWHWDNIIVE